MTGQQLKNSILQMAVQGKLVPQDPDDEPASVLLEKIRKEKEQLVKEGKIKKERNPSYIFRGSDNLLYEKVGNNEPVCIADEVPFEIPNSWEWVRLSNIFSVLNGDRGKNYPAKSTLTSTGIPFISALNLNGRTVVSDDRLLCMTEAQYDKLSNGKLIKGDVVVCVRGSLGKHGRYPFDKGAIASSLVILRCHLSEEILAEYIMLWLDSPVFFSEIKKYDNGTAQPNLAAKSLEQFIVPFPPLSEQQRIINKINEIMPIAAKYDTAYSKVKELSKNFPEVLKKSILQEAIQGKLVPQDPNDEPASVLLERIREEKQRLIKEGKIKKDKHESIIFRRDNSYYEKLDGNERCIDDELPFKIPESWGWTKIESISMPVGSKANQVLVKEVLDHGRIPVVSQGKELIDGYCNDESKKISTLPLVMFGDHTRNVKYIDFEFVIGADGTKFHKVIICSAMYVYYWMLYASETLRNRGYARHYSLLKKCYIPLPPLNEQIRIVKKLKEISSYIE